MLEQQELVSNTPLNQNTTSSDSNQKSPSFSDLLNEYEPEILRKGQFVEGEVLQVKQNVILVDVDAKRTAVVPPQDIARIDEDELAKISKGDEVMLYVIRTPVGDEDLLVSLQKGLQYQDWVDAKEHLVNDEILELEVIGHNKGGLMVSFGNLRGFIPNSHIPELQRISDQQKLTSKKAKFIGQELPLKVIEVDRSRKRLVLSAKEALQEAKKQHLSALKLKEGKKITGKITNVVKFGAFVDLGNGIEGLIHISEIAWEHVDNPSQYLTPGEKVDVLLMSVDIEEERVSLSRKALIPNPWEQFAQKHSVGDALEGLVTNITDFGAFVQVADNIEGLLHISEMHGTRESTPYDLLQAGETVLVRLISIQPKEERIALSQRRITRQEELDWTWQQGMTTS